MNYPPLTPTAWLRYDMVKRLLRKLDGVQTVLEIGVGEGAVGARLADQFTYVGIEQDEDSCAKARSRIENFGGTVLHGTLSTLPPAAKFDLICVFEVLEHIEDDRAALCEWRTRLNEGGALLVSVPAFQRRFGPWDERAGHFRRYEPQDFARLLASTGFHHSTVWTYGFPAGYVLEWARHQLARESYKRESMADRTAKSGRALQPPDRLAWVTKLGSAPFCLLQKPFRRSRHGIGLIALARSDDR